MSVNIRQRCKPKRPMGKFYEPSKLREWAKYWDCRQRDVRDAAKMSGAMVVDIQDWLRVNVPMTSAELAEKTHTSERYVREWLAAQAASGYAMYDPATACYSLSEEQAFALATEGSPAYIPGGVPAHVGGPQVS